MELLFVKAAGTYLPLGFKGLNVVTIWITKLQTHFTNWEDANTPEIQGSHDV
jgi:hypothetical protein